MTAQTNEDKLRQWCAVFAHWNKSKPAFNHEVKTANEAEFLELCGLMRKAKDWLKGNSLSCAYGGKQNCVSLSRLGYKFTVTYTPAKHIQQRASAIQAYHETKAGHASQEAAVARLMLSRTGCKLDTCTHDVVLYFRANPGTSGPDEKNSASRAMSNLHRDGVTVDGVEYRTASNGIRRNPATNAATEYYFLLPASAADGGQQLLF